MRFDREALVAATGGEAFGADHVGPLGTDTRADLDGAWFVALRGPRFDAHDFADRAVAAGAGGLVVERRLPGLAVPQVVVADTTRALQDLGRAARDRLPGPVVGITGSNGKTTTRALTALAVSPLGRVHQTVGNLNNHLGVPLTLVAAPEDAAVHVVEMGTSAPGEIRFLAELARPDVRLVINVGPAHLEELGGLAGVAVEKGAMYDTARPGDTWVVALDDPHLAPRADQVPADRRVTFGRDPRADVRVVEARVDVAGWSTDVSLGTPSGAVRFRLPAPGQHLAGNAAAAVAVAVALGVPPAEAAAALEAYAPVGQRLRLETLPGGVRLVDDAYNANPASVAASVGILAAHTGPGRRVAVLGDLLELGPDEARWHAEAAATAAGLDLRVLVGPRMGRVPPPADGGRGETWVDPGDDPTVQAERLVAWLAPGDLVLLKASRGARLERMLPVLREGLARRFGAATPPSSTPSESTP